MEHNPLDILFETVKLGDFTLHNRFIMASLTRCRGDPTNGIPTDLHVQYYSQRASAGAIFSECSPIANNAQSFLGAGGIYTKEQIEGWKKVTQAVHEKGGKIFIQIWHGGRSVNPEAVGEGIIGPSAIAIRGKSTRTGNEYPVPKEMSKDDIKLVKEQFRQGALNAKEAGFDGVELHGANGYLIDTFIRDGSNQRTDEYGGSIENRCRFCLEVIDILIEVFGCGKVGIKLSPVGRFQDMYDSDPIATYSYLLKELEKKNIAFVQLMELNEAFKGESAHEAGEKQIAEVCKTLRPFFKNALIINNNLTPESAAKAIKEGHADLVSFGRYFISNPDFIERVKNNWHLAEWDRNTFYAGGEKGYADYPNFEKPEESK
uniref:Predicted protein n=1 Tax=Hordeum vulgare subsp. vulgare TaxID=112509 RepID=F2DFC4_HORVV|nr:predicted protein [Hordeum vulgare subsp. vulgare]